MGLVSQKAKIMFWIVKAHMNMIDDSTAPQERYHRVKKHRLVSPQRLNSCSVKKGIQSILRVLGVTNLLDLLAGM